VLGCVPAGRLLLDEQRRRRWTALGVLESRADELDDEYRSYHRTIRIRPGARALLTGLKRRGARLALVSNAHPSYVEARLQEHRLEGFFDHVFEMVPPRRKPQTGIFEEAAERLRVPPEATVAAGNDLQLDILPALPGRLPPRLLDEQRRRSRHPRGHEGPHLRAAGRDPDGMTWARVASGAAVRRRCAARLATGMVGSLEHRVLLEGPQEGRHGRQLLIAMLHGSGRRGTHRERTGADERVRRQASSPGSSIPSRSGGERAG